MTFVNVCKENFVVVNVVLTNFVKGLFFKTLNVTLEI